MTASDHLWKFGVVSFSPVTTLFGSKPCFPKTLSRSTKGPVKT